MSHSLIYRAEYGALGSHGSCLHVSAIGVADNHNWAGAHGCGWAVGLVGCLNEDLKISPIIQDHNSQAWLRGRLRVATLGQVISIGPTNKEREREREFH